MEIKYHANNKIREFYPLVNGLRHGIASYWDENGIKWSESDWCLGKRHGLHIIWNDKGIIIYQCTWENDIKSGKEIGYNDNGIDYEYDWRLDNNTCIEKQWHANGNLAYSCRHNMSKVLNNKGTGLFRDIYPNPNRYCDFSKNGQEDEYWENGHLKSRTFWLDGKQYGKSKTWYVNGNIQTIKNYRNGVAIYSVMFQKNGKKIYETIDDLQNRKCTRIQYDECGKKKNEQCYIDGILMKES